MAVTIEFFGTARLHAGRASLEVDATDLAAALRRIEEDLPAMGDLALEDGRLRPEFLANLNGRRFVRDPATAIQSGDRLLILSADAGG